jgi:hypothetical protein
MTMPPLEQLFRLEIDFHRTLRTQAPGTADAHAVHTSYALEFGYDPLIRSVGHVTGRDLTLMKERMALAGDTRDVLAACNTLKQLFGIP